MIIDSHQHVFWHKRDAAGLIRDMDEHGIDAAWLLTWEIPPAEDDPLNDIYLDPINFVNGRSTGVLLKDVVAARNAYPDRFAVGYCPDPASGRAADLFEAAYHIHQVRICGEWKFRMLFDDPRCIELFRRAGKLNCPVVLHLGVPYVPGPDGDMIYQPCWYGGTVDNLERALIACPETVFIGHAPGFWREISGDARASAALMPDGPVTPGGRLMHLLDRYPNLYADLSAQSGLTALNRDPAFAFKLLTRYARRLLFGRDIYGGELMDFLLSLKLPATVMNRLLSDNARELVDLPLQLPETRKLAIAQDFVAEPVFADGH